MKLSRDGYKRNSKDKNNPYNVIPSGDITMKGVDFPVMGTDNLGNQQLMQPGLDYQFPGDMVFEQPVQDKPKNQVKKRRVDRDNKLIPNWTEEMGDVSSHLMTTMQFTDDDGSPIYIAIPMLYPTIEGQETPDPTSWTQFSKGDEMNAFEMAMQRGEVYYFNSAEEADAFAKGGYKTPNLKKRDGGQLPKAQIQDEILQANIEVDKWNKEYVQSPNYLNMLTRAKEKPSVINSRIAEAMNFDPYKHITYDKNNYSLGQYYNSGYSSSDGSQYPISTFMHGENMLNYNPTLFPNHPAYNNPGIATGGWPALAGHELAGHYGVDKLNRKQRKALKSLINWSALDNFADGNKHSYDHGKDPYEMRANLTQLRYQLDKAGIYDSKKGLAVTADGEEGDNPFTMEHLKQILDFNEDDTFKQIKPEFNNEILQFVAPEDIIWMMNNIASNDEVGDDLPEGTMRAMYGKELPKAQWWNPKNAYTGIRNFLSRTKNRPNILDQHGKVTQIGEYPKGGLSHKFTNAPKFPMSRETGIKNLELLDDFDYTSFPEWQNYLTAYQPITNNFQLPTLLSGDMVNLTNKKNQINTNLLNSYINKTKGLNQTQLYDRQKMKSVFDDLNLGNEKFVDKDFFIEEISKVINPELTIPSITSLPMRSNTLHQAYWTGADSPFTPVQKPFEFELNDPNYKPNLPNTNPHVLQTYIPNSPGVPNFDRTTGSLHFSSIENPDAPYGGLTLGHNRVSFDPVYPKTTISIERQSDYAQQYNKKLPGHMKYLTKDLPAPNTADLDRTTKIREVIAKGDDWIKKELQREREKEHWTGRTLHEQLKEHYHHNKKILENHNFNHVDTKDFNELNQNELLEIAKSPSFRKNLDRDIQYFEEDIAQQMERNYGRKIANQKELDLLNNPNELSSKLKEYRKNAPAILLNELVDYSTKLGNTHVHLPLAETVAKTQGYDANKWGAPNPLYTEYNWTGHDWNEFNNNIKDLRDITRVDSHFPPIGPFSFKRIKGEGQNHPRGGNFNGKLITIYKNPETGEVTELLGTGQEQMKQIETLRNEFLTSKGYNPEVDYKGNTGAYKSEYQTILNKATEKQLKKDIEQVFGKGYPYEIITDARGNKYIRLDHTGTRLPIKNLHTYKYGGQLPKAQWWNLPSAYNKVKNAVKLNKYNRSKDAFGNTGRMLNDDITKPVQKAASIIDYKGLQNSVPLTNELSHLMAEYTIDSTPFKFGSKLGENDASWPLSVIRDDNNKIINVKDDSYALKLQDFIKNNRLKWSSLERDKPLTLVRKFNENQSISGIHGNINDLKLSLKSGEPIQLGDITSWSVGKAGLDNFGNHRYIIKDFDFDTPALLNEYNQFLSKNQAKVWKEREVLLEPDTKFKVKNIIENAPRENVQGLPVPNYGTDIELELLKKYGGQPPKYQFTGTVDPSGMGEKEYVWPIPEGGYVDYAPGLDWGEYTQQNFRRNPDGTRALGWMNTDWTDYTDVQGPHNWFVNFITSPKTLERAQNIHGKEEVNNLVNWRLGQLDDVEYQFTGTEGSYPKIEDFPIEWQNAFKEHGENAMEALINNPDYDLQAALDANPELWKMVQQMDNQNTKYSSKNNLVTVSPGQLNMINSPVSSGIINELAHATGATNNAGPYGLSEKEKNIIVSNFRPGYLEDPDVPDHDKQEYEIKSDIDTLRGELFELGIYDAGTEDFTQDHLDQAFKLYKEDPSKFAKLGVLTKAFADKGLIDNMNRLVSIEDDIPEGTMRVQQGGSLPKAQFQLIDDIGKYALTRPFNKSTWKSTKSISPQTSLVNELNLSKSNFTGAKNFDVNALIQNNNVSNQLLNDVLQGHGGINTNIDYQNKIEEFAKYNPNAKILINSGSGNTDPYLQAIHDRNKNIFLSNTSRRDASGKLIFNDEINDLNMLMSSEMGKNLNKYGESGLYINNYTDDAGGVFDYSMNKGLMTDDRGISVVDPINNMARWRGNWNRGGNQHNHLLGTTNFYPSTIISGDRGFVTDGTKRGLNSWVWNTPDGAGTAGSQKVANFLDQSFQLDKPIDGTFMKIQHKEEGGSLPKHQVPQLVKGSLNLADKGTKSVNIINKVKPLQHTFNNRNLTGNTITNIGTRDDLINQYNVRNNMYRTVNINDNVLNNEQLRANAELFGFNPDAADELAAYMGTTPTLGDGRRAGFNFSKGTKDILYTGNYPHLTNHRYTTGNPKNSWTIKSNIWGDDISLLSDKQLHDRISLLDNTRSHVPAKGLFNVGDIASYGSLSNINVPHGSLLNTQTVQVPELTQTNMIIGNAFEPVRKPISLIRGDDLKTSLKLSGNPYDTFKDGGSLSKFQIKNEVKEKTKVDADWTGTTQGEIEETGVTTINLDDLKKGISYAESLDGELMINPESTATGLYGQRFSEIENGEWYDGTREEFAADIDAQNDLFMKRYSGELKDIPGLEISGIELYDEYKDEIDDFSYTPTEISALVNFLGRQGAREYLGYVLRDGNTLDAVFPDKYGSKAKQKNKTPDEYITKFKEGLDNKSRGGEVNNLTDRLIKKYEEGGKLTPAGTKHLKSLGMI